MTKQALRTTLLSRRRAQPSHEVAEKSACILRHVLASEAFEESQVVLAYMAMADEVQTRDLLLAAWDSGKEVVLPRVVREERRLDLYQVDSPQGPLRKGPFGILEPVPAPERRREPGDLDLICVPGIGFDPTGGRLGFGAGYYDRLLATCPPTAVFMGLAFELQLTEEIPVGEADVRVHQLITERRHILCAVGRARRNAGLRAGHGSTGDGGVGR